jgi:hypothetical protein
MALLLNIAKNRTEIDWFELGFLDFDFGVVKMEWNSAGLFLRIWQLAVECENCGETATIRGGSLEVGSNPRIYVCRNCGKENILSRG